MASTAPDGELKIFTERERWASSTACRQHGPVQNFIGRLVAQRFERMAQA